MAKTNAELGQLRTSLLQQIQASDLNWVSIPVQGGSAIKVTMPVYKNGYYVPATAKELWALAAKFQVFPLTRAVADQAHNAAKFVARKPMDPNTQILDFETYSLYLKNPSNYGDGSGNLMVSGAHKFWVLSTMRGVDPKAINYGFHIDAKLWKGREGGPYLDKNYTVIQGLGGRHNGDHWDYSQLIQFMDNLGPGGDAFGPPVDLRQALLDGNPAVWDEKPGKLAANQLPF